MKNPSKHYQSDSPIRAKTQTLIDNWNFYSQISTKLVHCIIFPCLSWTMVRNCFPPMRLWSIYCQTRNRLSWEIKWVICFSFFFWIIVFNWILLSSFASGWNGVQLAWRQQLFRRIQPVIRSTSVLNLFWIIWFCNWMLNCRKVHRFWLAKSPHRPITVYGAFWRRTKPHWNCRKSSIGTIALQLNHVWR